MSSETYTVSEVADYLGVHIETVRRWIRSEKLKATTSRGRETLIEIKDLEEFSRGKSSKRVLGIASLLGRGITSLALEVSNVALETGNVVLEAGNVVLEAGGSLLNLNEVEKTKTIKDNCFKKKNEDISIKSLEIILKTLNVNFNKQLLPALKEVNQLEKENEKIIIMIDKELSSLEEELNSIKTLLKSLENLNDNYSSTLKKEIIKNQSIKIKKRNRNKQLKKETFIQSKAINDAKVFLEHYGIKIFEKNSKEK